MKTLKVVYDEKVDENNKHDIPFWEAGCNHTYGLISIYFYEGEEVTDKGRSKKEMRLKRRHAEKARFLTSFGTEHMN